jgi:hypothetical protein
VKDGGGFNDYSLTNLLYDPLPALHYYTVEYYEEDYDSEEILEDCLEGTSGGEYYGELSKDECECIEWDEFYDEEKDEYRECTEDEKDEGKCDCDQMEDKYVDQYYYEQIQGEYLSTVELEHPFSHIDELTDEADTVELMSQYYETTEYQIEGDFDFDEGGDVLDWAEHDADVEYHLELLNDALYPDVDMLGDSTSVEVITEEQQLDLFHGAWPFDSVMEDEDKEWIMKDYPENAVKYLYKKWDQDGVSWEDMKLLGMQAVQGDGVTMLLKRYIMNTQAPIPVTSLWDCDDLAQLFDDDNHEELIEKYLCGNDPWDWDGWYHHNEFYEDMLDSLDDGSWKMIMRILGIKDKEVAARLLDGQPQNEEEEELEDTYNHEIDEIRHKITHAYSIEQEDATKRAIFEDIDDKIADWFDGTGKLVRSVQDGSYSWVIESDLRNWISEDDWDNTDYFQHHPDYADQPLEDVMRDMARLTPDQLFGEIMVEEFGPGDDYNDGKRGDLLEIDRKYFDGYWYPDISEEYFNDILSEDLYELVPESTGEVTPPEPLNEHAPPREFFRDPSGLRESVTNFKELYNASPRPLQQILMDQWKAKQNPEWHPEGNVLKHIITVTNRAFAEQPDNINLILSAYFHDLGKLATLGVSPKTGHPTAHGHEKVSSQLVNDYSEFIESLGGDPEEIVYVVSNHMKMKPRVWDVMRQSKKDNITDHPSFDNLDALSKIDRGGLQLDEEKMEFGKDKGLYDDDQYYDFTPFTNMEVKLLNALSQEFTSEDLERIGESDAASLPRALEERYNDIMKLFSIPARTMADWVIASKYARWALDNWGEAAGEVDEKRDYAQVKTPVKIYPSYFEVEAEESGWEKIFKHGTIDIPGFSSQDVTDRATADWYDWGGEMETYDYGDWESDGWEIESTTHRETIKEHKKGEINPKLKKGDIIRIVDIDGEHAHMPRRYNLYKVMEFSTANNHPDHWHYTLHALDHYDLDTLGVPRDRYLYPGDLWVHHRGSLSEQKETQLSPELEVGDSIRVIDVDRERENGETMYTTPPDELRPEILTPYIVVEKESAGHKAKWPWKYILLTADKYQDYLNGDYMVGRGTAKLLYPWIYQWIKVHKKPITEQKEILNPSLNIGDIIRVVDVDKATRYKQSAGSGMYRTLSRGELHGDDTIPTIMDTYYVTSPEPVNASQIIYGGEKLIHPNPYWNLLTIGKGNNPKEPDEFQLTTDDFDRGNRIITTNDKWIMVKKHVSNIPQEIEARQKEIDTSGRNITSTRLTEGEKPTNPLRILKEQQIDTSKIPKEEISPPLKVGDKIFMWDLEMDPAPPGGGTTMLTMPNTTVGTVVYVYEGNASEEPRGDVFRGGIKYEVDTYDGHFGLYQGVEDYDYYAEDGGGRDKWVILKNTPLTEAIIPQLPPEERPNIPNYIRRLLIIGRFEYKGGWGKNPQTFILYLTPTGKIVDLVKSGTLSNVPFQIGDTVNIFDLRDFEKSSDYTLTMGGKLRGEMAEQVNRPLQAVQKDFIIKRKFFESFDKMELAQFLREYSKDITPQQLGEKRKLIFDFLSEVKNKEITNENFYSHFLIGGNDWIKTYSTVLKKDTGLLSENGDKIKNLLWETTIHSLKNKNKEVTLREAQRNILPTADRLVSLWKETL